MKLLVDTHLILWAASEPERLSATAWKLIHDPNNTLLFSSATVWEVAITFRRGRGNFSVDPFGLRDELLALRRPGKTRLTTCLTPACS